MGYRGKQAARGKGNLRNKGLCHSTNKNGATNMAIISAKGGQRESKDATNEQASDCESSAFIDDSNTDTGYRIVRNEKRKRVNTGDSQNTGESPCVQKKKNVQ